MIPNRLPLRFAVQPLPGIFIVGCLVCGTGQSGLAQVPAPVAVERVSVIPMDGERVLTDMTVIVDEGRVRAMGQGDRIAIPAGATRVDGRGRYLIPGLWDMHVHFEGPPEILGMFLATGVTGARVMWGTPSHVEYRDRVARGELIGPELHVGGTIVEGEPPPELRDVISTEGRAMVRDSADGAEVVRQQAADGYDFIKVYNNVPLDAYRGIVVEARKVGIPVAGHVPFAVGLEGTLRARQASIEHLRGYVWHLVPEDAPQQPGADLRSRTLAWAFGDPSRVHDLATMTRDAGVWNVPTLSVRLVTKPDSYIAEYLVSEEASHLSDEMRAFYTARREIPWLSNFSDADFAAAMEGFAVEDSLIRALVGVGAGVLAGTDTPPVGFALHRELEEPVDAGLTPYQALAAATLSPASFLGRDDGSGMVTVGSPGDLVLLDGNPLDDITNTRRVAGLVRRGQWYDRATLDQLLAEAEGR
jgi:imidazolonepropionase-like amidohydrolase